MKILKDLIETGVHTHKYGTFTLRKGFMQNRYEIKKKEKNVAYRVSFKMSKKLKKAINKSLL